MKKSLMMIEKGFTSSAYYTKEFADFVRIFKKEFTAELQLVGAEDIEFHKGHFHMYGFFRIKEQMWYFSLSDVRWTMSMGSMQIPFLYRTALHNRDFSGGRNRWVNLEPGMGQKMNLNP